MREEQQSAQAAIPRFQADRKSAPTSTDNVAVTSGPTLTAGLASGATFPLGETTVTYEATDGDGNTGISSFSVTVEDTEAPTIVSLSANVTEFSSPFDFTVGENVVNVPAIDSAGNQATPEQIPVTITQGQPPEVPLITTMTINANRSMTIGSTAEVDSTVRVTFPDSTFQDVTATDGAYSVTSTANMLGGTVTVVSTDALGNVSAPATTDLFPDYHGPTGTITGAPARFLDETTFTITVTFSEAVTGFTRPDITVTAANLTAFAGAGPTYTAEITAVVATPITTSIAEGAAEDAFANPSAASGIISITNAVLTTTEAMIVTMAETRTRSTMSAQPKISRFLLGGRSRPLGNRGRH